jgi:acyl transferase domain-containing protein
MSVPRGDILQYLTPSWQLNVRGGHFLSEDPALFDANFFNLSAELAASIDPQFRLQLETTYEAFESGK